MIENSSAGLVMLEDEVAVSVTREEHYQAALARYPVAAGAQRRVAVELGWCTIGSGKYRGQRAIEVRLDGYRVGELTYLMSQRYGPIVAQVTARGGRAGCQAVIERGPRGVEVTLRLPRQTDGTIPIPLPAPASVPPAFPGRPVPSGSQQRQGVFSSHRPLWIGAAVVAGLILLGAVAGNEDGSSPSTTTGSDNRTTTRPPTTTARPTTTTTTSLPATTTTVPPEAATVAPPVPKTTTKRATPAPPPPPAEPEPEPQPVCDPNYSGCVPVASDVDCAGGSGDGPAYVAGPIKVIGSDIYRLDHDKDGTACE